MKIEKGKIDIAFVLIFLVIIVVILYVLAPQNVRISDPNFLVQYWFNITRAVSSAGQSISTGLQSVGQGIINLFSGFSPK